MLRLSLPLRVLSPGRAYGLGGEAAFGLAMDILRRDSEAQAARVHDHKAPKPMAIRLDSPGAALREGNIHFEPGSAATLVVDCLDEETSDAFGNAFGRYLECGGPVRLGSAEATADATCAMPLISAQWTYEELFRVGEQPRSLLLEFRSPTSFRRAGEQVVMPLPEFVFGSLLAKWNTFSPVQFRGDLAQQLGQLSIVRYNLRTVSVRFERYRIVGFQGRCEYLIPPRFPPFVCSVATVLGAYGQYAGVGYKTTMGLGHTIMFGPGGEKGGGKDEP